MPAPTNAHSRPLTMSIEPTSDVKVDVLAGHLGHLTEAQQQAFAAFRKNLAEAQLYVPEDQAGTELPSHDEPTLLYVVCASSCGPEH